MARKEKTYYADKLENSHNNIGDPNKQIDATLAFMARPNVQPTFAALGIFGERSKVASLTLGNIEKCVKRLNSIKMTIKTML